MEVFGLFLVRFAAVFHGMKVHPVVVILNKVEVARKDSGVCEVVLDFSPMAWWSWILSFLCSCPEWLYVLITCREPSWGW